MSGATPINGCKVCVSMSEAAVIKLDELMGDPRKWDIDQAFGSLVPTQLTPSSRKIGAVNMGLAWVRQYGFTELTRQDLLRHYVRHVPIIANSIEEYAAHALVGDARSPRGAETRTTGYASVAAIYDKALDLGSMSLSILTARLEDRLRRNEPVDSAELMAYAGYAARLAMSAAALKRGGTGPFGSGPDYRGFRGGPDAPGQKIAHHRVRMIAGEYRPVTDDGPADRAHYNERARLEGREGL
jgi:hypothetical protein